MGYGLPVMGYGGKWKAARRLTRWFFVRPPSAKRVPPLRWQKKDRYADRLLRACVCVHALAYTDSVNNVCARLYALGRAMLARRDKYKVEALKNIRYRRYKRTGVCYRQVHYFLEKCVKMQKIARNICKCQKFFVTLYVFLVKVCNCAQNHESSSVKLR